MDEWILAAPRLESAAGLHRVTAVAGGEPIWFESADAALVPAPEAFASLLLIPALHHRARVRVEVPLDGQWLENTARLSPILSSWWGVSAHHPFAGAARAGGDAPVAARGQCFTGGVDSFHTLITRGHELSDLVFVHGYDIPLADGPRMAAFERSLREVAARRDKRAIVLRSNLRSHPLFASVSWEWTHGAAVAAAAHLLGEILGALVVPSSFPTWHVPPWGSHPDTDPLWSTGRARLVHDASPLDREAKIAAIAHEPLVWSHLRVCWENRAPIGNCSRCAKCVRTMLSLAVAGTLDRCSTFDRTVPLDRLVDGIGSAPPHQLYAWQRLADLPLPAPTRAALRNLVRRSQPGRLRRLARALSRRRAARR